jgi:biotin synthase
VDLCAIVNAKSGNCPEDCAYCAQSKNARSKIKSYPLLPEAMILKAALRARKAGARRFCMVTSGRRPGKGELKRIATTIAGIRAAGLLPCATLGILGQDELEFLRDSGLERYHHNLECSERFFPRICSTHSYREKMRTLEAVKKTGLSLCSGGIFGLGEGWQDRLDMAFTIKKAGADSVPINFLMPIAGTRLGDRKTLPAMEALKIISLYRLIMPEKEIRVCGGRHECLGESGSLVFAAGADGLLIGDYLTKKGIPARRDLALIKEWGLRPG